MREKGITLEHRIHRTQMRRNMGIVVPIDPYLTAVCLTKARKKTEQSCLSASRRSKNCYKLSLFNLNAHIIKDYLVSKTLGNIIEFNNVVFVFHSHSVNATKNKYFFPLKAHFASFFLKLGENRFTALSRQYFFNLIFCTLEYFG